MTDVVRIPLPPEPPHDRVIEAVDAYGQVADRYRWDGGDWFSGSGSSGWWDDQRLNWHELVRWAMLHGWTLRHVPAEEET